MKKTFRTIVSIILSITFVISYLNFVSNDVAADTATVSNSISEGVVYTSSDDDEFFYFTPSKSGYYYFESDGWGSVFQRKYYTFEGDEELQEYYDYMEYLDLIPLGLPELIDTVDYLHCYYLTKGDMYRASYEEGTSFSVRYTDKYVTLTRNSELTKANLDKPFTLSILAVSSVTVDEIRYRWTDIPFGDIGYNAPSATLNLSQLLDDNNEFVYSYSDSEHYGDFGRGFVSVCVEVDYQGTTRQWYVSFTIEGYESELSMSCQAYEAEDNYNTRIEYTNLVEYSYDWDLFDIVTETSIGTNVSFQWCKVDTARKVSGNYTDESDLYTPLRGETSNRFVWTESVKNAIGQPYCGDFDEEDSVYHDLVCIVTFDKGNTTLTKVLDFRIVYSINVGFTGDRCFDVEYGSTINLPQYTLDIHGNPGQFDVSEAPSGITYKYTWYKCGSIPESTGYGYTGFDANDIEITEDIPDLTYLGTGKEFSVNTQNLTVIVKEGENENQYDYVSCVACLVQPMYNGHICHSHNFDVECFIFELHYGSLKFTGWTNACSGRSGSDADLFVEVESITELTYQWQQLVGNNWVNLNTPAAKTSSMSIEINEETDNTQYRCAVTDLYGYTIYSEPCLLYIDNIVAITSEPTDFIGVVGDTAKFTVGAEGDGLTYQWQLKKGNSWADQTSGGANTPTFSVKVNETRFGKTYRCKISDKYGNEVYTNEVKIIEKEIAINIVQQPTDCSAVVGSTAKFTVAAEGEGLTYQWQLKKGSSWANQSSGGATTPTFSVKADMSRNGKVYRCLITDANGDQIATDPVTLTVKEPSITITQQPTDCTALVGSKAKFTVAAEGEGLTYQWQLKKGSSWANQSSGGATTPTFSVTADVSRNGKIYRCLITNSDGEQLASDPVTLTVKEASDAINIVSQPQDIAVYEGSTATFFVHSYKLELPWWLSQ